MRHLPKLTWLLLALAVLAAAGAFGVRHAAQRLQQEIVAALGPDSEVGAIRLHWDSVEIERLRLKAAKGWPTGDELRAARILVAPDLRSLFSERIVIRRIEVDGAYLSLLRTRDGRLRLLPSLIDRPEKAAAGPPPRIDIGHIVLSDAAIAFHDASVRKPPLAIHAEKLDATVDGIRLPELDGRTAFDLRGTLKGVRHHGTLALKGWAEIASRDTENTLRLRGVDLIALQPYLLKGAGTGIRRGTLDLDLATTVERKQLRAPGTVTLHQIELDERSGGFLGSRRAAIALMQDREGKIVVRFELAGNMDDPAFSLNENIATRFGSALADSLGVSVEGVAKGASAIGGAIGGAAAGAGKAIKGLFD